MTGSGGAGGLTPTGCPRTVTAIDSFDETGRAGPATGGYFNLNCAMGSWYAYGDALGTVTPAAGTAFVSSMPGNGGTGYAAHIMGSGFSQFGVGLGVNLNSSGTTIHTVDASAYSGFTFWAMGTSAGSRGANMVRVEAPILASSSAPNGGTCTAAPPMFCDGNWGKVIVVTSTWTQYTIKWSDLTLDMNAIGGTAFDPHIIGFHWRVDGVTATPASINLWVDDLAFAP